MRSRSEIRRRTLRLLAPLLVLVAIGAVAGVGVGAAAAPGPGTVPVAPFGPAPTRPADARATVAQASPFAPRGPVPVRAGPTTTLADGRVQSQTLAFGPAEHHTSLDVYWSAHSSGARTGGVLLIHGGAWIFGTKTSEADQAVELASRGYVAASVDYRTVPRYQPWPAAAEDVFAATDVLRARAASYRLDPNRLVAAGWSAGGQLAMLLGTSAAGSSRVAAVISWSGPSDLTAMVERDATRHDCTAASGCGTRDGLASSFAHSVMHCAPADCPSTYRDASPLDQVSQDDVPMLLINSTHELISTRQATEMAAALHRAHLAATVDLVPGSRHGSLLKPVTTSLTTRWLRRFAGAPENSTS